MSSAWNTIRTTVWNIFHRPGIADIVDIIIVAVILYQLLMLTRQTRGSAVLKGLLLLAIVTWFSDMLGLTALNWLLQSIVNNGALVLVILFQPELRKMLEQIGRSAKLEHGKNSTAVDDSGRIVNEIISCLSVNILNQNIMATIAQIDSVLISPVLSFIRGMTT